MGVLRAAGSGGTTQAPGSRQEKPTPVQTFLRPAVDVQSCLITSNTFGGPCAHPIATGPVKHVVADSAARGDTMEAILPVRQAGVEGHAPLVQDRDDELLVGSANPVLRNPLMQVTAADFK